MTTTEREIEGRGVVLETEEQKNQYDVTGSDIHIPQQESTTTTTTIAEHVVSKEGRNEWIGSISGTRKIAFRVKIERGYDPGWGEAEKKPEPNIHRQRIPETGTLDNVVSEDVVGCELVCVLVGGGKKRTATISTIPWTDTPRDPPHSDGDWVAWYSMHADVEVRGLFLVVSSYPVTDSAYSEPQTCTLVITTTVGSIVEQNRDVTRNHQ